MLNTQALAPQIKALIRSTPNSEANTPTPCKNTHIQAWNEYKLVPQNEDAMRDIEFGKKSLVFFPKETLAYSTGSLVRAVAGRSGTLTRCGCDTSWWRRPTCT